VLSPADGDQGKSKGEQRKRGGGARRAGFMIRVHRQRMRSERRKVISEEVAQGGDDFQAEKAGRVTSREVVKKRMNVPPTGCRQKKDGISYRKGGGLAQKKRQKTGGLASWYW